MKTNENKQKKQLKQNKQLRELSEEELKQVNGGAPPYVDKILYECPDGRNVSSIEECSKKK